MVTMSSQDKIKKGQRKSAFCDHFMVDWDDHHFCPKLRDDKCIGYNGFSVLHYFCRCCYETTS